jgi:hypothetical protein
MSQVQRARKKPVEIEFMLWGGGAAAATPIIDWVRENGGTAGYDDGDPLAIDPVDGVQGIPEHMTIRTLEGNMRALPGDRIVRGLIGEFYPIKPAAYDLNYDTIQEDQP